MLLSSLNRLRRYISDEDNTLTDNVANNRSLMMWLTSVSAAIEKYLNRTILVSTYTEYKDVAYRKTIYPVKAYPISSITSVKEDSSGLFDGDSETTLDADDYYISTNSDSVVLSGEREYVAKRGLQIIYVGGLAYHAVNVTLGFTGSVTGTLAVGNYVKGATSGAVGIINTAPASNSLVIETFYGIFTTERIDKTATEGATADGTNYVTATSVTRQALCAAYPEITTAAEMEVRFMYQHKMDFENSGTAKDGTTRFFMPGSMTNAYTFTPATLAMLQPYRRYSIGSGR